MADPTVTLQLLFHATILVLLVATALLLTFTRPATLPKRLLALVFGFGAASQVYVFIGRSGIPGASQISSFFFQGTFQFVALATLALFWVYPSPARLRSAHGAIMLVATLVHLVYASAFFLARALLLPSEGGTTALDGALRSMIVLAQAAVILSVLVRATRLPVLERRPALVLLVAIGAGVLSRPGVLVGYWILDVTGGEAPASALAAVLTPDGPLSSRVGAIVGLAEVPVVAWLVVAHRSYLALGATGYGLGRVLLEAVPGTSVNLFSLYLVFEALGALHVINRYGAFDTVRPPVWARGALATVSFLCLFLATTSVGLRLFGEGGLALVGTSLAGLVLGTGAVVAGDPRLVPGVVRVPATSPERLGPYRAALSAEIHAGASLDETSRKLRALRDELGVTDTEHALMDYTIRTSGAAADGAAPLATGDLFAGRYRVERGLGKDGTGPAYLCRDELAGRTVVVKLLEAAGGRGLQTVLREARALAAVKHASVATLHDVVVVGDRAFLVTEYAEGGSLAANLDDGPLSRAAWRTLAKDLLDGLVAVHEAGVVHRDVKPSNVLVTKERRYQLADFGVARVPGLEATRGGLQRGDMAVGTIAYMSPEVARSRAATPQSDVFSAGATLFEALTGKAYLAPRDGESAVELQMRAARAAPFDRSVRPERLGAWFARALDPDPRTRFASAREMRDALEAVFTRRPNARRPRTRR